MREKLDTVRTIETPEGVELTLRVAGPVSRALAWAIDIAIRSVLYLIALPLLFLGDLGQGIYLIVIFLAEWFYPVFFEVLRRGRTPGKSIMGLMVVHDDGTPVTWTPSIVRNLLRVADFMPMAYLLGIITMVVSRDFKRLGDLVAGTVVVYPDPPAMTSQLAEAIPIPVPIGLELAEQRAVIGFAERIQGWSTERAEELADRAEPLVGRPPSEGVRKLIGMAQWLLGRR